MSAPKKKSADELPKSDTMRQAHFFGAGPQVATKSQENTLATSRKRRGGKHGKRVASKRR